MAVTEQTPLNTYTANGVTTVFAFSFLLLQAADLSVQVMDTSGTTTTKTLGVDYTVAGLGAAAGGTVTFLVAPSNGSRVVIFRDSDIARATDYQNNGDLLANTLNLDMDRLWLVLQEIFNGGKGVPTSLRVPNGETVTALPNAAARASRVLAFDGSGKPLMLAGVDASSAAALALDLANNGNIAKGANQVGLLLTGTNEVSTMVAPYLNLKVKGVKANFGCVGDGVTNDYIKLANALQATGKLIELEAGTYLYNSALPAPTCSAIVGEGELVSILKPGAGVAKGLSIGGANYPMRLADFQIIGAATTNATGLWLGDAASCAVIVEGVRILSFGGASGVGLRIGDALKTKILKTTVGSSTIGCLVQRMTGSFPTTVNFDSCVFTNSVTKGCKVLSGYGISFTNTDFESSGEEGFYCDSSAGTDSIDIILGDGCWFEDNWTSLGGARTGQYHAKVSGSAGRTLRPVFRNVVFNTDGSADKPMAIYLSGNDVQGWTISNPRISGNTVANAIVIDGGSSGTIEEWPTYLSYLLSVSDALGNDYGPNGRSHTYTPTFGSDVGNEAATFTAAPSVVHIRHKRMGRQLLVSFDWTATLKAVTPQYLTMTLPPGVASVLSASFGACNLSIAGGFVPGMLLTADGGNAINVRKADNSLFASGAALVVRGQLWMEAA